MGLMTKEIEVSLGGSNIGWFESKGYTMPRIKDKYYKISVKRGTKIKVNVNDLPDNSNIKVKCSCDNCKKEYDIIWQNYNKFKKDDGKIYCAKCANKLYGAEQRRLTRVENGTTFKQWCIENNQEDILKLWDYNLNKYKPDEVSYGTTIKCWFKCSRGIHESELKDINTFTSKENNAISCNRCGSFGQWLIDKYGKDAIEEYWSNKNKVDIFKIGYGSKKNVLLKCPVCNNEKFIPPNRFTRQGLGCNKCSDGISYPNKIAFNILEQLNVKFINEYSPDWVKPRRYDFYFEIDSKKYILEMDGGLGHGNSNKLSNISEEESKFLDDEKDRLAHEHNIVIIRINCNYGMHDRLDFIKNNLLHSKLIDLFDLSKVDWKKCHKFACNSFVKDVCNCWNDELDNIEDIANKFNLSPPTIRKYLKQGMKLKWCYYNGQEEQRKNINNQCKKVYCVELNKVFDSISDAGRKLNIANDHISQCCRQVKKYKTSGKLPDGTPLHWMYYDDYLKQNKQSA
jgi:hypothetical protein